MGKWESWLIDVPVPFEDFHFSIAFFSSRAAPSLPTIRPAYRIVNVSSKCWCTFTRQPARLLRQLVRSVSKDWRL